MCGFLRLKIISACALVLCAGCVSLVENSGKLLDGSVFKEKNLAVYKAKTKKNVTNNMELMLVQNKAGERSVIISLTDYPMIKLRGSAPDENKSFYLTEMEYLGGNVQGWNEYTMELAGNGSLTLDEDAVININREIEKAEISKGRIRRFDTRITGIEALTNLRNRRQRILALVEWMSALDGAPKGQNIDDFSKYWKPLLFPEMVSKKKRPSSWRQEGDAFVWADSIRWNNGYTERVFPEELWPVRNSSTMLRDWEEALPWIYLEYEWERVIEQLSRETTIPKTFKK